MRFALLATGADYAVAKPPEEWRGERQKGKEAGEGHEVIHGSVSVLEM